MNDKIRAFIALEVGSEIRSELSGIQSYLKPANADMKWIKPANIHLTLKFLGNVPIDKIDVIKNSLNDIAAKHKSFDLSLGAIGAFPKIDRPRVVWVGLDKGAIQTRSLADDIEKELFERGLSPSVHARPEGPVPKKQSFTPHLTLGRVRSLKNINRLVHKIKSLDFSPGAACAIDRINLYRSTLTPKGPIYKAIVTAPIAIYS